MRVGGPDHSETHQVDRFRGRTFHPSQELPDFGEGESSEYAQLCAAEPTGVQVEKAGRQRLRFPRNR